jgi:hypothetical protein
MSSFWGMTVEFLGCGSVLLSQMKIKKKEFKFISSERFVIFKIKKRIVNVTIENYSESES